MSCFCCGLSMGRYRYTGENSRIGERVIGVGPRIGYRLLTHDAGWRPPKGGFALEIPIVRDNLKLGVEVERGYRERKIQEISFEDPSYWGPKDDEGGDGDPLPIGLLLHTTCLVDDPDQDTDLEQQRWKEKMLKKLGFRMMGTIPRNSSGYDRPQSHARIRLWVGFKEKEKKS